MKLYGLETHLRPSRIQEVADQGFFIIKKKLHPFIIYETQHLLKY
jgi:hypothetical protein